MLFIIKALFENYLQNISLTIAGIIVKIIIDYAVSTVSNETILLLS